MATQKWPLYLAGAAAGLVNALFGTGGGMILVPMLRRSDKLHNDQIFPATVSTMLPICIISAAVSGMNGQLAWEAALPYLPGSALGGMIAATLGSRVPVKWLHRILGVFILWGGLRSFW